MATMNISLPDPLKHFIDDEVREGRFSSASDYMRDLVRERQRAKAEDTLKQLIAEGLASGSAGEVTSATFDQMRQELRKRYTREEC